MASKEEHKKKLLETLSDPEIEFPNRVGMAVSILGFSDSQAMYKVFTTLELSEIEIEAMEERKRRSAPQRAQVYKALLKAAKDGDTRAMKEFLDRTEGKVVEKRELTGKDGNPLETVTTMEAGPGVSRVLQALEEATTTRASTDDERGNKE